MRPLAAVVVFAIGLTFATGACTTKNVRREEPQQTRAGTTCAKNKVWVNEYGTWKCKNENYKRGHKDHYKPGEVKKRDRY
jgi:hypothetical protein